MITQSEYLPRQMNGPVINAYAAAQKTESNACEKITSYLKSLRIKTAEEKELENIGLLIGYPRPLVPDGFNNDNMFLMGQVPIEHDSETGYATADLSQGGQLASTETTEGNYMALDTYRKILPLIAKVKRYGITIRNVDRIAREFSPDYTISWSEAGDINLAYTHSIGFKNVWLLTQLFYRLCTAPQVNVSSGTAPLNE